MPLLGESDDNFPSKSELNWKDKMVGIFLSLAAGLCLLGTNTMLKKMELNFVDAVFITSLVQMTVSIIVMMIKRNSPWISNVDKGKTICSIRALLAVFWVVGGIYILSDFIAISFMQIGDAMAIILSSILPTTIIAAIFMNERMRIYKWTCIILVIIGVILVIRPPFFFNTRMETINNNTVLTVDNSTNSSEMRYRRSTSYYFGVISALVCMISTAIFRVLVKLLVENSSTSSIE